MSETRQKLLTALGVAAVAMPLAMFGVIWFFPDLDPMIMAMDFHFYIVGFTALGAAIACAVIMASARTLSQTRLLFLGLAFLSIAGVFSVHGLATPGYLVDEYYKSVSVSSWLSAALGGTFAAISVVGLPHRVERHIERSGRAIFAAAAVAVFAYIGLSIAADSWLDWVPIDNRNLQLALGFASIALTAFAAWRFYQAYQFARLPSQIAMVITLILLMEVQVILIWGRLWHLSWWMYHGLYFVAIGVLFAGWAMEVRRAGTLRAIADALSMRDALAQLNRGLESPIVELVDAVEAKDKDTFGHVRRVSSLALGIGRRLGLPPSELRNVVLAAEMHDVGKISVPDSILAKPGPLTESEFSVVRQHTKRGHEIALQVPALRRIARAVRHHHERLDGSGYPDHLKGNDIPLLSRIIAVADTYDAITSKRPYRNGRGHDEAIAEIIRLRGIHFDPRCVDAFVASFSEQKPALERAA
jgi:HD-GYP domain-containing protein (c-di-GMP phosphodiesterase class II)